jgi:hypothetical protein
MKTEGMYELMHADGIDILSSWTANQRDYGDAFIELGPKGQFSDIWRKIAKLKKAVWEDQVLVGEQPDQIIAETIHHLLILRFLLAHPEVWLETYYTEVPE